MLPTNIHFNLACKKSYWNIAHTNVLWGVECSSMAVGLAEWSVQGKVAWLHPCTVGGGHRLIQANGVAQPSSKVNLLYFGLLDERVNLERYEVISCDCGGFSECTDAWKALAINCFRSARSAGFFIRLKREKQTWDGSCVWYNGH